LHHTPSSFCITWFHFRKCLWVLLRSAHELESCLSACNFHQERWSFEREGMEGVFISHCFNVFYKLKKYKGNSQLLYATWK
jgi:hypothetical protein